MSRKKNKKKRQSGGSPASRGRETNSPPAQPFPEQLLPQYSLSPDPRAMERVVWDLNRLMEDREFGSVEDARILLEEMANERRGSLPAPSPPDTPLEKAQEIMYEAFESESSGKRRHLARRALKVSKDCADAYVLLAEENAQDLQEAKEFYEQGVEAGERTLGEEIFEEDAGHFWAILETRPYMRAREGLAACLWEMWEKEEAMDHYVQMLKLNPNDNQGIRYILAGCLLDEDLDKALGALLEQYEEDASAFWVYTRALLLFRKEEPSEGASEAATAALTEALETNPFVPLYLLGHNRLPDPLPQLTGFGDESEAATYVIRAMPSWLRTPGAIEWLRGNAPDMLGHSTGESPEEGGEVIPPHPRAPQQRANEVTNGMTDELHSLIDEDRESEEEFLAALEAAEAAAVQVLREALPTLQSIEPPSEELYAATYRLRTGLRSGGWPYEYMLGAADWSSEGLPEDDTELWLGAAGALISPREDPGLDAEEEAAIIALEPADWVGAIVGVVREGLGADVSPEALVGYIDGCPEVEGVVDPDETPLVETAFELILPAWEAAGAVDENRRLTPIGRWGLPRALAWAFDHDFDDGPAS